MKKVISIIVALAMVVTFCMPAFAVTAKPAANTAIVRANDADDSDKEDNDALSGIISTVTGLIGDVDLGTVTAIISGLISGVTGMISPEDSDTAEDSDAADSSETGLDFTAIIGGLIKTVSGLLSNVDLSAITGVIGDVIGGAADSDTADDAADSETADDSSTSLDFTAIIGGLIETVSGLLGNVDLGSLTDMLSGGLGTVIGLVSGLTGSDA